MTRFPSRLKLDVRDLRAATTLCTNSQSRCFWVLDPNLLSAEGEEEMCRCEHDIHNNLGCIKADRSVSPCHRRVDNPVADVKHFFGPSLMRDRPGRSVCAEGSSLDGS